jgi:hypothetical protein
MINKVKRRYAVHDLTSQKQTISGNHPCKTVFGAYRGQLHLLRPFRLMARTLSFHDKNVGSIPAGATNQFNLICL